MPVRVLSSDTLASSIDEVIKCAKETKRGFAPLYIIVPDRFTLECERKLLDDGLSPIGSAMLNVRVLTFSMLFRLVAQESGVEVKALDKARAVLMLWRAIQDVADDLVWFRRSSGHYNFAERMFNTLNQLTSSMVDFEKLEKSAKSVSVRSKFQDIVLIYKRYRELIAGYSDSASMLGWLINNIEGSESLKLAHVFICGFEHLSRQRLAVVERVTRVAHEVVVAVRRGSEFEGQLLAIAGNGIDVCHGSDWSTARSLHNLKAVSSSLDLEVAPMTYINSVSVAKSSEKPSYRQIRLFRHKSLQDEATTLANEVRGLLNSGVQPRDIVVLLADFDNTREVFGATFGECNIPINIDQGVPLSEVAISRRVQDLLALANHDKAENFLAVARHMLEPEEFFKLENFCLKRNLGLKRYLDREKNETLNTLQRWVSEIRKQKTVVGFSNALSNYTAVRNTDGLVEEHRLNTIAQEKIEEILRNCASILGDMRMDIRAFGNLFLTLANAVKISTVPTFANRVLVAPLTDWQPSPTPHIIIANTHDGNFPPAQPDTDILTAHDIRNTQLHIEPTAAQQNARSRTHANQTMASSTKGLIVSHLATTSSNEPTQQSEIFEKLVKKFPNALVPTNLIPILTHEGKRVASPIHSKHFATHEVLTAIGRGTAFAEPIFYNSLLKSVKLPRLPIQDFERPEPNIEKGAELFFGTGSNGRISVTTLESFYTCPYCNFIQRGLGLKRREIYRVGANIIGSLLHKIVEEFTKLLILGESVSDNQKRAIVKVTLESPEFEFFCQDPINLPLVEVLKREALSIMNHIECQVQESEFKPKFVERKLVGSIDVDGQTFDLVGKIDRIDENPSGEALIIDYKTGASGASFSIAKDVPSGAKLQLPLYMGFLPNAVGAVYYPLLAGFATTKGDGPNFKGLTPDKTWDSVLSLAREMAERAIRQMRDGYIRKERLESGFCTLCLNHPGSIVRKKNEDLGGCK